MSVERPIGLHLLRTALAFIVDAVSFLHQGQTLYIQARKSTLIL
jgi:hypothetical protein